MGRPRKNWSEETIEKMIAEGRGKGRLAEYKPWIRTTDFSSEGNARRVRGIKTGREHHFLSNIEFDLYLLLEWAPTVIDIREQFPLPRDLTVAFAEELGIKHPCYPKSTIPIVITVDICATYEVNGEQVIRGYSCKPAEATETERTLEKIQIERFLFQKSGHQHHLVIDQDLPTQQCRNIESILGSLETPGELLPYPDFFTVQQGKMLTEWRQANGSLSVAEFCHGFEGRNNLTKGYGLRVARQLMYHRKLATDLNAAPIQELPVSAFQSIHPFAQQIRRVI